MAKHSVSQLDSCIVYLIGKCLDCCYKAGLYCFRIVDSMRCLLVGKTSLGGAVGVDLPVVK